MALSREEREQFLAEPHIAALSVNAGGGRGPLTVPIWYQYTPGGQPWFITGAGSRKHRLIETAGLDLGDVKRQRLDLTKTVDGMKDGSIDGLVWSGGLPTPAVTDLFTSMGDKVKFIDVTDQLKDMQAVNEVYEEATIPAATYELDEDVPTIAVPNVLVVREDMPANMACALTSLMVDKKDELVKVHPAAKEIDAKTMSETGPIPLHDGSERALEDKS